MIHNDCLGGGVSPCGPSLPRAQPASQAPRGLPGGSKCITIVCIIVSTKSAITIIINIIINIIVCPSVVTIVMDSLL